MNDQGDLSPRSVANVGAPGGKSVVAMLAGSAMSDMGLNILPLILGSLTVIFGISQSVAGFVIFTELAAMGLTTLALSPALHRLNRRTLATFGAVLICVANIASFAAPTPALLFLTRALSGAGSGAIVSATVAVASEHGKSHRVFVAMSGISMFVSIGMFTLVPRLIAVQGPRSVFILMALLAAIATILSLLLPKYSSEARSAVTDTGASIRRFSLSDVPSVLLCGAFLLFFFSLNGAYFYVERIGNSIGMQLSAIGDGLAVAALVSLLGPVAASLVGLKFGRIGPIIAAVALNAAGVIVCTHTRSPDLFIAAISMSTVTLTFAPAYFMGLAASLVSSGRLTSASRGAATVGSTITPAVSAVILMYGGSYRTIGLVGGVSSLLAIVMLLALRRYVRHSS